MYIVHCQRKLYRVFTLNERKNITGISFFECLITFKLKNLLYTYLGITSLFDYFIFKFFLMEGILIEINLGIQLITGLPPYYSDSLQTGY